MFAVDVPTHNNEAEQSSHTALDVSDPQQLQLTVHAPTPNTVFNGNQQQQREVTPESAVTILALMAIAAGALLPPPQEGPSILFQMYLTSVACAMGLLVVTFGAVRPNNFLVHLAAQFLFLAFLCIAIMAEWQHLSNAVTTAWEFVPAVMLFISLPICHYAFHAWWFRKPALNPKN